MGCREETVFSVEISCLPMLADLHSSKNERVRE